MRATTRHRAALLVSIAIVVGVVLALLSGVTASSRTPIEWPGITVEEDGSVTVDESQVMQDVRATLRLTRT